MKSSELKNKLQKSLDFLEAELSQIRTGRANPSLIEDIKVDAYGSPMTIKELGSITLQDAQNIIVSPWDKSLLSPIAKAIRESDLNLNPAEAGTTLRVPIPPLTEERRKDMVKIVSQKIEDTKNSMRNIRQEAMKEIDKAFSDNELTEDDKFDLRDQVEEIVKDFVSKADSIGESKKSDLLKV